MRRIFFDTEFTGLHKGTTLISIGLVSDEGERFYAELTDFDESQCDEWITKNVLDNLILSGNEALRITLEKDMKITVMIGNKEQVSNAIREWLNQRDLKREGIQFVSDVCHYDMVLLIDLLWGNALNIPLNITPFCHDINQDIAMVLDISEKEAFDFSREELLTSRGISLPKGQKHNALYDAEVIKAIFDNMSLRVVNKEARGNE